MPAIKHHKDSLKSHKQQHKDENKDQEMYLDWTSAHTGIRNE